MGQAAGKMIFHCKNCHIYSRLDKIIEELIARRRTPGGSSRRKNDELIRMH